MTNYNNSGSEFEFQWVEEAVKFTGYVFLAGLVGLSHAASSAYEIARDAIKETTRK
jgi:hypothetical protein